MEMVTILEMLEKYGPIPLIIWLSFQMLIIKKHLTNHIEHRIQGIERQIIALREMFSNYIIGGKK